MKYREIKIFSPKNPADEFCSPTEQSVHFYVELLWLLRRMTLVVNPLSFPLIATRQRVGPRWNEHFLDFPYAGPARWPHRQCPTDWVAILQKICSCWVYRKKECHKLMSDLFRIQLMNDSLLEFFFSLLHFAEFLLNFFLSCGVVPARRYNLFAIFFFLLLPRQLTNKKIFQ